MTSDFTYPLPARIICALLGVPERDHGLFTRHAPALASGLDPAPMRTQAAALAADQAVDVLSAYLHDLVQLRRRQPGDDLLSRLIAAEEAGDRLSESELVATCLLLLMAGHETTANLLGNGLLTLLRHPGTLQQLRDDPGLDRTAVDELLRHDGPVQMVQRVALEDVEIAGAVIPKGSILIPLVAAANRDPAVFDDPDHLDLARSPNPHLAFGGGAHFCIGAPLARVEARLALRSLIERLPGLRLDVARPRWRASFTIRALQALPVSWG